MRGSHRRWLTSHASASPVREGRQHATVQERGAGLTIQDEAESNLFMLASPGVH